MIKNSLHKRLAAVEAQGPGIQINTVADWARCAALEMEGVDVGPISYSPAMQAVMDYWQQVVLDDDVRCAFWQFGLLMGESMGAFPSGDLAVEEEEAA